MAEESLEVEVEQDDGDWGTIQAHQESKDKPVEFEIEGEDEKETPEAESDSNEEESKAQAEDTKEEEKSDDTPKELEGIETKGAQKRIRRLVQQRKEREAEITTLEERIKEYESRIKERDKELIELKRKNVETSETQVTEQIELAESAYHQALEEGDAAKIVAAQKALNKAEINLNNIRNLKTSLPEEYVDEDAGGEENKEVIQKAAQQDFDPKAIAYAEANSDWFGTNETLTASALRFNQELLDEGYDPADDEFYEEIDNRMHNTFPKYFTKEEEQQEQQPEPKVTSKPSQVVGGASRTVSNPATGRNKRVKLTQKDIETAEKWGIPLERYAEQKLNAEVAEGEYTTINTARREG